MWGLMGGMKCHWMPWFAMVSRTLVSWLIVHRAFCSSASAPWKLVLLSEYMVSGCPLRVVILCRAMIAESALSEAANSTYMARVVCFLVVVLDQ